MGEVKTKNEAILTAQEVSDYLKIPLSTLYLLSKTGRIKAVKIGKHWRYLAQDVHDYFRKSSLVELSSNHDRRTYSRINTDIPASLTLSLHRNAPETEKGTIDNLSEGGVLFRCAAKHLSIKTDDPVEIHFEIEDKNTGFRTLQLFGRVVHQAKNTDSQFGIKFRPLASEDEGVIREYVG